MARILVLYGATDGHTGKVARFVADRLRAAGAGVDVVEAQATSAPDPGTYAGVVIAASVHVSTYQRTVRRWVAAHAASLQGKPSAFLSVCLAVLQADPRPQRDLAAILERFLARTAPALRRTADTLALLAVDEAHCISEWGDDFRPSYQALRRARYLLAEPPTVPLTGSATPAVRSDIIGSLGLVTQSGAAERSRSTSVRSTARTSGSGRSGSGTTGSAWTG